jgi:hypothetical protein
MDTIKAIDIAEGIEEPEDENEFIKAWQFLIDSGMAWSLQGRFGRIAEQLIEEGICHAKTNS